MCGDLTKENYHECDKIRARERDIIERLVIWQFVSNMEYFKMDTTVESSGTAKIRFNELERPDDSSSRHRHSVQRIASNWGIHMSSPSHCVYYSPLSAIVMLVNIFWE